MQNNKNILLATVLSAMILLSWTWFYEKPKMEKQELQRKILAEQKPQVETVKTIENKGSIASAISTTKPAEAAVTLKNRDEILAQSAESRVDIESENLHGSISLKGAPEEFEKMRSLKNLYSLSLGPRILRADTAVISALTLVQEFLGDFNFKSKF